ncbi:YceI family protein [uncultured Maricaulis sp.]|uniref:YceI family protein n=1 Tax=uncultured Maricaulis sp. TaxID=174710 RepID=UPI00263143E7|nr:YceI family protein [uncultured Maricaulis sp.]
MRLILTASLMALLTFAAACSQPAASGDWRLDGERSRLSFVSIKSGEIAEAHSFSGLSGAVAPDGQAELVIDLATVETGIDIRNERMREHLFEIGSFAEARVTTALDLAALADLETGERRSLEIEATVSLHGQSIDIIAPVIVTDIDGRHVLVESAAPVLLHIGDFGLTDGLATLQELAGLPSIAPVSPVSFSLLFTRG